VKDKEIKKDSLLWERKGIVLLDAALFYLFIIPKNAVTNVMLI
jgi:hypothetical protein